MAKNSLENRREFIVAATVAGAGIVLAGCQEMSAARDKESGEGEEKVTPGEDLMQEHGVLKRILLVYGESIRRLDTNSDLPPEPLNKAARLVKSFVEEYHEEQEEKFVFPRLKAAGKETQVVDILLEQHRAGRRVTDRIIALSTAARLRDTDSRREIADRMRQFIRMYNVHEVREDTVVFPAFRDLLSKREYDALGEEFEKNERKHFGQDGFDMAVDQVTEIEKALGIYDLAQFTPQI